MAGFSDKLPVLLEAVLSKMEQPVGLGAMAWCTTATSGTSRTKP